MACTILHRLTALAFGSVIWFSANAEAIICPKQADSYQVNQCVVEKLKDAEARLELSYHDALAGLPEKNPFDQRKTKAQLTKAQEAWRIYRDNNCTYIGGLQGGNNFWVSYFANECELLETEQRIKFFNNPPSGG